MSRVDARKGIPVSIHGELVGCGIQQARHVGNCIELTRVVKCHGATEGWWVVTLRYMSNPSLAWKKADVFKINGDEDGDDDDNSDGDNGDDDDGDDDDDDDDDDYDVEQRNIFKFNIILWDISRMGHGSVWYDQWSLGAVILGGRGGHCLPSSEWFRRSCSLQGRPQYHRNLTHDFFAWLEWRSG